MTYQFSPSELDYKPKCKRCFYLLKKHKLSLGDFPPPVFSSFDVVQKGYFLNKNTIDVTDQLPSGKFVTDLPGRITSSNLKDKKERAFSLFGAPDLVVEFDQGGYGIIDFKTTNLSPTKSDNYKFQLEAYAQIFANPGATKSKVTPKLTPVTHMGIAQFFPTEIFTHAKDECDLKLKMLYSPQPRIEEDFYNLITSLIDLLEEPTIPNHGENCKYCKFALKNIQDFNENNKQSILKSHVNVSKGLYELRIDCGDLYLREDVSFDQDCEYCCDLLKLDIENEEEKIKTLNVFMEYTIPDDDCIKNIKENKLTSYEIDEGKHLFRIDILKFNQKDKTLEICEDFWIGNESLIVQIIKKLDGLKKIYFVSRNLRDQEGNFLLELSDDDQDKFIRTTYHNPSWKDEMMLDPAEDKDDLEQLIQLRK